MYGLLAERATDENGGSGLYTLAAGALFATAGGLTVTNFRGFADRFVTRGSGQRPAGPALARLLGGVFAVVGAATMVMGVVQVARGEIGSFHRNEVMPLPVAVFALIVMTLAMARVWRKDDRLRRAWTAGGLRRVCAVLLTLSVLGFVACTVLGYAGAGYVFWGTGGFAGITLHVKDVNDAKDMNDAKGAEEQRKPS
ncbi:hypothetical protein ACFY1L_24115 [Streptomyces sp. NPDC001663]|uniref:hypothetical protein n=1 Tax=Streptomyces sp. NPDC001663 TaxID=3364597 RepID=UPI0036827281